MSLELIILLALLVQLAACIAFLVYLINQNTRIKKRERDFWKGDPRIDYNCDLDFPEVHNNPEFPKKETFIFKG